MFYEIKTWLLVLTFTGFFSIGNAQKRNEKPPPAHVQQKENVNVKSQVPLPPAPPKIDKEDIAPPPPPKIKEEDIAPSPLKKENKGRNK